MVESVAVSVRPIGPPVFYAFGISRARACRQGSIGSKCRVTHGYRSRVPRIRDRNRSGREIRIVRNQGKSEISRVSRTLLQRTCLLATNPLNDVSTLAVCAGALIRAKVYY